jgi:tetratricopeptide (TPR) repeat protein
MGSGPRWLLIVALVVLGLGEWGWGFYQAMSRAAVISAELARHVAPAPTAKPRLFTREETYAFLAAAKRAEAIKDPLQRCLAYPDPPGSHWSHDSVVAYCHYRLQPVMSFAEAETLIQHGQAAELDRRLAAALHAQQTQPDLRGALDRIYLESFDNGSFDIRPTLDAWKRDSPKSAFAWAASGTAYVAMATDVRGSKYMKDTPQENVDSMDKLLAQADSDLRQAIALDPKLTPAYAELIHAGRLGFGRAYTSEAIRSALAVAPDDYAIRSQAMWALEPKWGGSLGAMDRFATQAQAYAHTNPMMKLMLSERAYYEVDNCDCGEKAQVPAYPSTFDQVSPVTDMSGAGYVASAHGHSGTALIYLSETLRFDPFSPFAPTARAERAFRLTDLGAPLWALADADELVSVDPHKVGGFKARAYADEALQDYAEAIEALKAAIALDESDSWPLTELGNVYVYKTREWDKAWEIASQDIQKFPQEPDGWVLRGTIQMKQPRAGLKDTYDELLARFGNDPEQQATLAEMRDKLALQAGPEDHGSTKVTLPR